MHWRHQQDAASLYVRVLLYSALPVPRSTPTVPYLPLFLVEHLGRGIGSSPAPSSAMDYSL